MESRSSLFLIVAAALMLAACSSTPINGSASASTRADPPAPAVATLPAPPLITAQAATPKPAAASTPTTTALAAYLDPQSAISKERSVYFAFDGYAVEQAYTPLIERHGKFLAAHPTVAIRIEGNTDERGSPEYNLALGQRRADTVLKALKIYGVSERQMEAVSFGEEKPKAAGHDEQAWAQNRRADLEYPKK